MANFYRRFVMLPDPLHPAVVHFPIVLAVLLPFLATGALWAIRRGTRPVKAWGIPVAAAAALTLSSWVAVETGEREEEKVEPVVAESSLERHEEQAERFLILSGVLLVITAAGMLRGVPGRAARLGATVGAVGLVALGAQVGHSGGNLVYRDGAASAYTGGASIGSAAADREGGGTEGVED
jgi:uncharacterized membrane protein